MLKVVTVAEALEVLRFQGIDRELVLTDQEAERLLSELIATPEIQPRLRRRRRQFLSSTWNPYPFSALPYNVGLVWCVALPLLQAIEAAQQEDVKKEAWGSPSGWLKWRPWGTSPAVAFAKRLGGSNPDLVLRQIDIAAARLMVLEGHERSEPPSTRAVATLLGGNGPCHRPFWDKMSSRLYSPWQVAVALDHARARVFAGGEPDSAPLVLEFLGVRLWHLPEELLAILSPGFCLAIQDILLRPLRGWAPLLGSGFTLTPRHIVGDIVAAIGEQPDRSPGAFDGDIVERLRGKCDSLTLADVEELLDGRSDRSQILEVLCGVLLVASARVVDGVRTLQAANAFFGSYTSSLARELCGVASYHIALGYLFLGDLEEGLKELRRVVGANPSSSSAVRDLAQRLAPPSCDSEALVAAFRELLLRSDDQKLFPLVTLFRYTLDQGLAAYEGQDNAPRSWREAVDPHPRADLTPKLILEALYLVLLHLGNDLLATTCRALLRQQVD